MTHFAESRHLGLTSFSEVIEMRLSTNILFVLCTLALAVLGGCGAGSETTSTLPNQAAVVTPGHQSLPSILVQPADQSVVDGQMANLSVVANGTGNLTYQWLKHGKPVEGATSSTYVLGRQSVDDHGATYSVTVTDRAGSVTSNPAKISVSAMEQVATGRLGKAVRFLTDAEDSLVKDTGVGELTVTGIQGLAADNVVVGKARVFKITAVRTSGSQTLVSTTEPELDELFESLKISGNFSVSADQMAASEGSPSSISVKASGTLQDSVTKTWPFHFSEGGYDQKSTLTNKYSAAIEYNYDKSAGGLLLGRLDISAQTTLSQTHLFKKDMAIDAEREIARIRIPINVSFFDAALRLVGVRVVSVQIPVYVGARVKAGFKLDIVDSFDAKGSVRVRYEPSTGTQISGGYSGGVTFNSLLPTTPAGLAPYATQSLNAGIYLRAAPSLVFLDTVAMIAVDNKVTLSNDAQLQVVPDATPYCLTLASSLDYSAFGYLKGVGIKERKTRLLNQNLHTGKPRYYGSCRTPVTVTGGPFIKGSVAKYGENYHVDVRVAHDPSGATPGPGKAPGGTVRVTIGAESCEAKLSPDSPVSSTGGCSILLSSAGKDSPVQLAYLGDPAYAPGSGMFLTDIEAPAFTLLGQFVQVTGYHPDLNTPMTNTLRVRVGSGVEFSSGSFQMLSTAKNLVGQSTDIGFETVDLKFSEAKLTASGSFNGFVIKLDESAPRIQGCSVDSRSSITAAGLSVTCSADEIRIGLAGVRTLVGSRVLVNLDLVPPLK